VYAVVETYEYDVGECCNQSYCISSSPTVRKTSAELQAQAMDALSIALHQNHADAIVIQGKVPHNERKNEGFVVGQLTEVAGCAAIKLTHIPV
jgi:hypothetical protein